MAGDYHLEGLAVPDSLENLHDLLHQVRQENPDLDATDVMSFETAIIEIHGNVVQHGKPRGCVLYTFELDVLNDSLVGVLGDNGEATPDLASQIGLADAEAESGRGLWLARAALDELEFVREADHNTWRMVKKRSA
jgi:serine/threonine-protein kinase RsbW